MHNLTDLLEPPIRQNNEFFKNNKTPYCSKWSETKTKIPPSCDIPLPPEISSLLLSSKCHELCEFLKLQH